MQKGLDKVNDRRFTPHEKIMLVLIFVSLSIFSYCWIFFWGYDGLNWCDFITQREVCEYTLKGYDIYSLRGEGNIYMGFHAVPWGCVLGNIFYPGFLPLEEAKIYFLILNALALAAGSYILYKKIKPVSGELGFFALLLSVLSVDFLFAVYMGNGGGVVCVFMFFAWTLCDTSPYISGILTGLAMIKPQAAAIICILMLIMRKIKPLIVGALIDIAGWLTVSIMTKKGMFELLYEFLFSSDSLAAGGGARGDIFMLFFSNQLVSIAFSMLLGILFVSIIYVYLQTRGGVPEYFKIYPAMLAANFWCYGNITEGYLLILPAVICLLIMMNQHSKTKRIVWFSFSVWTAYGPVVRSVLRRVLHICYRTLEHNSDLSKQLPRTIFEIGLIVIGIMICFELRHIYRKETTY